MSFPTLEMAPTLAFIKLDSETDVDLFIPIILTSNNNWEALLL